MWSSLVVISHAHFSHVRMILGRPPAPSGGVVRLARLRRARSDMITEWGIVEGSIEFDHFRLRLLAVFFIFFRHVGRPGIAPG